MTGTNGILFGIAMILTGGFVLLNDVLVYGRATGLWSAIAFMMLPAGLFIAFLSLVYSLGSNNST